MSDTHDNSRERYFKNQLTNNSLSFPLMLSLIAFRCLLQGVRSMYGRCLDDICMLSGGCLECVWMVARQCLQGVLMVPVVCLEDGRNMSDGL